jgi:hypothetical protein
MALDINKIKSRLNSLSGKNQKSNLLWKPVPGKQEVRIVPYKFQTDDPFVELKFHYNLNGKTYLSPDSFGRPDPIVEFASRLKKSGNKEDWQSARKLEPKTRTFAPILVRGLEHEGVKFWGFGKQVYQELMSIMTDSDYGDITDLAHGRDVVVEFKTAEECGKNFPETTIRVKPNMKPAVDPTNRSLLDAISNQTKLTDLFPEPSYEDLAQVMSAWLSPEGGETEELATVVTDTNASEEITETPVEHVAEQVVPAKPALTTKSAAPVAKPTTAKVVKSSADVASAFDTLFGNS